MRSFFELLQIIKLAVSLYKKAGYSLARQKLLKVMDDEDDKETADFVNDLLNR